MLQTTLVLTLLTFPNFAGNGENERRVYIYKWAFCYLDAHFPPAAAVRCVFHFYVFLIELGFYTLISSTGL